VEKSWDVRTSLLLGFEGHVLVVEVLSGLLLGLLVVNGVCTRCLRSAVVVLHSTSCRDAVDIVHRRSSVLTSLS
jgi:hypothetical protein